MVCKVQLSISAAQRCDSIYSAVVFKKCHSLNRNEAAVWFFVSVCFVFISLSCSFFLFKTWVEFQTACIQFWGTLDETDLRINCFMWKRATFLSVSHSVRISLCRFRVLLSLPGFLPCAGLEICYYCISQPLAQFMVEPLHATCEIQ